ncbi:MAG: ABC transporter ATP-binding protein [Bacteroidota bacterium]
MAKIVTTSGLSKSYDGKKWALSNCSFSLEEGTICAVVGESGCGKTTLLRLIAGLERPEKGRVELKGAAVTTDRIFVPPQKRQVGFVFQDFALFPHLTVEQNIAFGLKNNKKETVTRLLRLIKMEAYAKSYPSQLSGGQQQRVALARTLAIEPLLLLLDEPFSNLDAALKTELRQEVKQIVKRLGTTMLFITHDLADAIDIADEIIFLKEGIVLQHHTLQDFAKKSQHEDIQKIIAELSAKAKRILEFLE